MFCGLVVLAFWRVRSCTSISTGYASSACNPVKIETHVQQDISICFVFCAIVALMQINLTAVSAVVKRCKSMCVLGTIIACRNVNMRQYQHWCACVTPSISACTKRNTPLDIWSLKIHGNHFLSTEMHTHRSCLYCLQPLAHVVRSYTKKEKDPS